jgi:uncharacterized membrane protein
MGPAKSGGSARVEVRLAWAETVAVLLIVAASIAYLVSGAVPLLIVWETAALTYLLAGLATAWPGRPMGTGSPRELRQFSRWSWLLPLASSASGGNSALIALAAKNDLERGAESALLAAAASLGVVLAWALLHVGFSHIYQAVDALQEKGAGIDFPDDSPRVTLDYLYFAFSIGTSFSASAAAVRTPRIRRVVLLHSVLGFFYNALVVAVAIQVLQGLVGT